MLPFFFDPRRSISHFLILTSVIVTLMSFSFPFFSNMFGFYWGFWIHRNLFDTVTQISLFQFIHGSILHILMNSYFLYTAWVEVEKRMTQNRYILFFVTTTLFVALWLIFFAPHTITIGISGFCMALLSYLWVDLNNLRHPNANQILIMLVINIAIGLTPGISFAGHLAWAIWWFIWWKARSYYG